MFGFLCEYEKAKDFENNSWVNLTGEITKGYYYGDIPVLKITSIEKCDAPTINPYGIETIWEGLGFFDYIFLPHYKSNHKETKLIDDSVEYCNKNNIKYRTLRDGDVIIVDTSKLVEQEEER